MINARSASVGVASCGALQCWEVAERGCVNAATRPCPEGCKFRSGKGNGDAVIASVILVEAFRTGMLSWKKRSLKDFLGRPLFLSSLGRPPGLCVRVAKG